VVESEDPNERREIMRRRDFLRSLRKWSQAVISGVLLGGVSRVPDAEAARINRRGELNRGGGWINGGGGWLNNGTNWINRGGSWRNGGGGWLNGRGW
jgi:hypothetical protein